MGKQKDKDCVTSSAISSCEVPSLNHEVLDDAMEDASFIPVAFLKRWFQLNAQVEITLIQRWTVFIWKWDYLNKTSTELASVLAIMYKGKFIVSCPK